MTKLEAFELCCYHCVWKMSSITYTTNEQVLICNVIKQETKSLEIITQNPNIIYCLTAYLAGLDERGDLRRKILSWLRSIKQWTGRFVKEEAFIRSRTKKMVMVAGHRQWTGRFVKKDFIRL